jgi:methoxymalonate biosynthesis protein
MTIAAGPSRPATVLDRVAARRFVTERIAPRAGEFDRTERVPADVLAELSAAGMWGAVLPVDAGGTGVDRVTFGAIHEEVGRGCSSVRSLLTVHSMVAVAIHRWGTAGQREQWLPRLCTGEVLGAFCLTEPEAGSDTGAISTRAVRQRGRWILDGHKKWITGGQVAGLFLVFAQGESGMAAFLVPRDAAGVEVVPIHGVLGTRGSMLAEIRLSDVDVGPDALVGPEHFGSAIVMVDALDLGRYSVASGCVGIAQACLDLCGEYTSHRRVHDSALRDLPLIRAKVTDMVTGTQAARLLCERAGRLRDADDQAAIMATWMAKYFAAKTAAASAVDAVQILGANGCSADYPAERLYRDAKVMEIIEGSTEIQRITIAEEAYRDR